MLKQPVHGEKIVIETEKTGDTVTLSIADNGCGIDHDFIDRIFDPFYTTKNEGAGLGLSVSKRIAQSNGGTITVKSNKNTGTKVVITFKC